MTDQEYTSASATWRREFVDQLRDLRTDLGKANERLDKMREQQHADKGDLTRSLHDLDVKVQAIHATAKTAWIAATVIATAFSMSIPAIISLLKGLPK